MEYIKGIEITSMKNGVYSGSNARKTLVNMKDRTGCNTVILTIGAFQETAHSDQIYYNHRYMPSDEELIRTIDNIKQEGLGVILKPIINCKDGTWRAHINFFDYEVICEPKWSNWFKYYQEYLIHYAKIAEITVCEMFVVGFELVQTQRKEKQWRQLIEAVRKEYSGLISYSTDKYSEDYVKWWDALDVISSNGLYPIKDWDYELKRIERLVHRFNKPFFFSEIACKSCVDASNKPNVWGLQGDLDINEQLDYYKAVLKACNQYSFINGMGIWEWTDSLYEEDEGIYDRGYNIYAKPAEELLASVWRQRP